MEYASDTKPRRAINSVDALLSRVLSLSFSDRWHFFDKLVGRPEVTAIGFRISERRLSPRPNAQRDAQWTRLHDSGLTYDEIAYAHNANRDTVAKAVQRFRRRRDSESVSTPDGDYHFGGGRKHV